MRKYNDLKSTEVRRERRRIVSTTRDP